MKLTLTRLQWTLLCECPGFPAQSATNLRTALLKAKSSGTPLSFDLPVEARDLFVSIAQRAHDNCKRDLTRKRLYRGIIVRLNPELETVDETARRLRDLGPDGVDAIPLRSGMLDDDQRAKVEVNSPELRALADRAWVEADAPVTMRPLRAVKGTRRTPQVSLFGGGGE